MSICFVYIIISLSASDPDSLKQALKRAGDVQQAAILNQLATALLRSKPAEALDYAQQAERLSLKHNQPEQTASSLKLQGNYYYTRKDFLQAINLYRSALPVAKKTNNQKLVADLYNNLGQTYTQTNDYAKALENLQKSLSLRKALPTREDEITSLINIGLVYWNMQNYPKSAQFYASAAKMLDKASNPKQAAVAYNNLGNAYSKNGETVKALDAYIRSLRIKEVTGEPAELAAANANIGNLYYLIKDYNNSIAYYQAAQTLYTKSSDTAKLAQITGNLGVVYNELKAFDNALEQHRAALAEFRKKGMLLDVAKTLNNIGNVNKEKKNYEEALVNYQESIEIKSGFKDIEGLAVTYNNMGEIKFLQKDYDTALKYSLISLEAIQKINSKSMLRNNYLQLAEIYAAKQDFHNAYLAQKNYDTLDSELFKAESRNVLAELMIRFETEEKTKEVSLLKKEHQLQKRKLAEQLREKLHLFIILGCIILVTLVMGVMYQQKQLEVNKRKAIQNQLELLNTELENRVEKGIEKYHTQQQIITQKSKLEALGKLSAGIAHEINQPLSALSMSLDNIQMTEQIGKLQPEYFDAKIITMQNDIQRIRQIIEHVRLFSRDQKDERIEQIDVNATLLSSLSLQQTVLERQNIEIIQEYSAEKLWTVGNHFKLEQVFLNLISNARDAMETKQENGLYGNENKTLSLRTALQQDQIIIEIEDNGCGIPQAVLNNILEPFFTTKNPDKGTGLGLSISYGIISEMHGTISVQSMLNYYTKMIVTLPYLRSSNESA